MGSASDWIKIPSTNQKHYPYLGSDASSVWNFCARSSDVNFQGNQRSGVAKWQLFSEDTSAIVICLGMTASMDSWSAESLVCIKFQGYKKRSIAKNHVVTVWFFPPCCCCLSKLRPCKTLKMSLKICLKEMELVSSARSLRRWLICCYQLIVSYWLFSNLFYYFFF